MEKEGGRGGGGRKSGGRRSHVFLDEVDQPGLFERACGPTMPTSGATATHFTSSIIPSTFPCGRGAGRRGGEGKGAIPSLPARALPTTSRSQKTPHASTVHGEGFSSAPATVERPLECHSSKFATRQVASSRMALPASSSGDEVEGNPSSQTGRGLGDQIFAYPPREDGIGPPRTFLVFLPSTLLRFHAWSRFRGVTDSRRGNRE